MLLRLANRPIIGTMVNSMREIPTSGPLNGAQQHAGKSRHHPLKSAPFTGESGPHLIRGSLGPNIILIVQPFLQGSLLLQTERLMDRPTDHDTPSVAIRRIYLVL